MRVVMCQNISGGTEKGAEKVGRGSGFQIRNDRQKSGKNLTRVSNDQNLGKKYITALSQNLFLGLL